MTTSRLVGIVTHDDVIDVVVKEATEDVHRMGAVGPLAENYLEANFVTVWRNRAFWLALPVRRGAVHVHRLSHFEDAMQGRDGARSVRAAVHLDRRQLRLAGGHADHSRHGPRPGGDSRTGCASCGTSC